MNGIEKESRQREFAPPKYIPDTVICDGRMEAVARIESAPDGGKIKVTATTVSGGRRTWTGTGAYIDASLRFVIVGYHGIEAGYWEDPE